MKINTFARKEELWRFPCRYIESIKSPDGCVFRSDWKIREVFRVHFRDRFVCWFDLPVKEFHNYLADFLTFRRWKWLATSIWLLNAKSVTHWSRLASNKSPGLEGLLYQMSHMFLPILMDVFSHWFALTALLKQWLHCLRKAANMSRRN